MFEVQSPFLDGTKVQFAWDSTSIDAFKRCPRYYQYSIIEGWRPREDSDHLRFGLEYHQALHDYETFKLESDHDTSVRNTINSLILRIRDWTPSNKYKTCDNLVRTVIWYLDHFNPDPAETIILQSGRPAVEVSFRFELDFGPDIANTLNPAENQYRSPYILCGHLDRIVNFGGETYVMDRKTTTTTPSTYYFNQFEPNTQMTLYTLASQVVLDSPIKGVIIDVAQVGMEFSRFTRGFTYRTQDQLDEWLQDLEITLSLAQTYAEVEYWPMNDTACDKYGGCRFRSICSRSPQVREAFLESNFERGEKWNPLKPR